MLDKNKTFKKYTAELQSKKYESAGAQIGKRNSKS